jgi:mRNA interferase MazF
MASTSTEPHRGEVWLVSFGASRPGEPGKNRPAIVVSADRIIAGQPHEPIVVVPLSSSLPTSTLRPEVGDVEGVDRSSRAIPRAIRGVARSRLLRRLGALTPETLAQVERALVQVLDLNDPRAMPPAAPGGASG